MRKGHYIALFAALALTAALYWGVNTTPPPPKETKQAQTAEHDGHDHAEAPLNVDSMADAAIQALPDHAREEALALKENASVASSSVKTIDNEHKLAELLLQHKQPVAAAHYFTKAAKLENSEKSLNFAARLNSELFRSTQSPSVRSWALDQAISTYEMSMKLNPDNDTVIMALAACYIDGTSQPMQGIQLLRNITQENPDHIAANLMLGQLSIRSGQMDKAAERFEKVLSKEPENTEALYFLAEVYKEQGKKDKAIELLEKCKAVINNPDFSREIDEYIKSFK